MGNIFTTENLGWLGLGAGVYYLIASIIAFFPAFVICIAVSRMFFGDPSTTADNFPAEALSVILFFVFIGAIVALARYEQYFIVLIIYIITAWPFLYILNHWCNASDSELFPVPLDWCFLF